MSHTRQENPIANVSYVAGNTVLSVRMGPEVSMRPVFERRLTVVSVLIALTAAGLTFGSLFAVGRSAGLQQPQFLVELCVFAVIVASLVYGGLVYQVARWGYLKRRGKAPAHIGVAPEEACERFTKPLVVLIPSYKEELAVIHQTALSGALIEYPNRRVCVLLDDPPAGNPADMAALQAARRLLAELNAELAGEAAVYAQALDEFEVGVRSGIFSSSTTVARLASLYHRAANWLEQQARGPLQTGAAHVDAFFNHEVLLKPAAKHRARAAQLHDCATLGVPEARREYRRLASLFASPIGSFERKRYVNLSHASNKAMNLNAYIGILGGSYTERESEGGIRL